MFAIKLWTGVAVAVGCVCCTGIPDASAQRSPENAPSSSAGLRGWRISGPYTHENLSVYLIHGDDLLRGRSFLTLQEALAQKKAQVHETGNVNELAIENLSEGKELFIQVGEIVRGGKQDRVLAVDLIIGPRSGKVAIGAFCVERGRWSQRGSEYSLSFSSSDNFTPSNALKVAIVKERDQGAVWQRVAEAQERLGASLGADVTDDASATSLELSLESKAVRNNTEPYVSRLSKLIDGKRDAIGLIVAINGKLYSADVYASPRLFRKLRPKLLESSATEAIAWRPAEKADTLPTLTDARGFLLAAEDGQVSTRQVSPRVRTVVRDSAGYVLSETTDTEGGETWIHRSYIKK